MNYYYTFFTNQFAFSLVEKLDPQHMIFQGKFARESMVYINGEYVKDLRYLNRDLRRVVVIESDSKHIQLQKENAIILPVFKGDKNDNALNEILPFLERKTK